MFSLSPKNSFHIERIDPDAKGEHCEKHLMVYQVSNWCAVSRQCAEKAVVTIRHDDRSWGQKYCANHAREKMERLLAEITAKPEEEELDSVTVQES